MSKDLEDRVAALERVVLGGALPEGIAGIRAPSAEKTKEQQAAFDKEQVKLDKADAAEEKKEAAAEKKAAAAK